MNILVAHGPNLNLIGKRNKELYGSLTLHEMYDKISEKFNDCTFTFYQTNFEGELIDIIQEAHDSKADGIMINPGAYTHTSVALRDALEFIEIPKVAVHLSNIEKREDFRKVDYTYDVVDGRFMGKKIISYYEALDHLIYLIEAKKGALKND